VKLGWLTWERAFILPILQPNSVRENMRRVKLNTHETDVIIVGGGPTGLTAACEIALAGYKVLVFERLAEPMKQSRALTIHPRSVEIFAMRGLLESALKGGMPLPSAHFGQLPTRLDFSVLDTDTPYTLFVPQVVTEQILRDRAIELGVEILVSHQVENISQSNSSVTIKGVANGGHFTAIGQYLIGCDGARSMVRESCNIEFVGTSTTVTGVVADVKLDTPPEAKLYEAANFKGRMFAVPMGDFYRLAIIDFENTSLPTHQEVTLDEVKASVKRIAGEEWGLHDPSWLSRFGNATRNVVSYRKARIFIAGDAAHIHFPSGGQGLNVSIQDSFNLAWKIVAELDGYAPEDLLDSYHNERHPVGKRLSQNTLAQTSLFLATGEIDWALRDMVSDLFKSPEVNKDFANRIAAFDICYPEPIISNIGQAKSLLIGTRQRNLELTLVDGTNITLFELMHDGKWLDVQLSDKQSSLNQIPANRLKVVHLAKLPEQANWDGLKRILIRPDGHIAAVS